MWRSSDKKAAEACWNMHDIAALAKKRLPSGLYDFIGRGAEDEVTIRNNISDVKQIALRQRVGIDVSHRDISTELLGERQSMPVALAITGLTGMIRYRGEELIAQAAAEADVPFTLGTMNFTAVERIREICGDKTWYQIYPARNRDVSDYQVTRARKAGVKTLLVTLDAASNANREYLKRSGFGIPIKPKPRTMIDVLCHPHWLLGTYLRYYRNGMPRLANMPEGHGYLFDAKSDLSGMRMAEGYSWAEIKALRSRWKGALIVKGLSTAEDARLAVAQGADGVVVSNHGGRNLDGCVSSIRVLPEVVDAVGDKATVMVDGGFLRGADVLKALAIGAKAVLIGRAQVLGLGAAGKPGVDRVLQLFKEETDRAIAMLGCCTVDEINRNHVLLPRRWDRIEGF